MHGLIFTSFRAFVSTPSGRSTRSGGRRSPLAAPPHLDIRGLSGGGVSITYTSPRGLCELLEGLVVGIARSYGDAICIDQPLCMHRGDTAGCTFFVTPA